MNIAPLIRTLRLTPQVSIVVACYNAQPYLTAAIESIMRQTYKDWEMVVVNDGSTDGSLEELHQFARGDSRVRVFDQPNRGQQAAANFGIKQSRGALIARMDADDISAPDRIDHQVAFLNAHPDVGLVGGQISRLGEKRSGLESNFPLEHDAIIACLLKNHHALCNPAIMFRRDLFNQIGGYWDHDIAEDWDMFLRMGEVSRLANLDSTVLQYRFHRSSINGRRIVEAQLFNEYAADRYVRRQSDQPPISFDEFLSAHRSRKWPASWAFKADALSIGQYRQAIAEIYGGKSFFGYPRLAASMMMSPARTGRRVINMAGRILRRVDSKDSTSSTDATTANACDSSAASTDPSAETTMSQSCVTPSGFPVRSSSVESANVDAS